MCFKMNVESEIVFSAQIWQRLRVLRWQRFTELLERFQRHHPRRNAGAEIFRQKRSERLMFPGLNIARAPIVHQDKTEDVIDRASDGHQLADRITRSNQERHYQ